ncbi:hypothetical protein F5879DRAFT_938959 [Lentinula edodes]|uniref:uncharacterized protein n=1 Tax=Lentinula edodes TaxID=5353 RepID=UPI001BF24AAA|nr:uncharacterized protein C8R40DRAFT_1128292 [Lentinula edodes]KAF8829560.1 hypothetical protein HHX47_DHR3001059 [Lentinula edodes]KAH7869996.1 hypothetical protein C8R40DRAFT_1128292 [Lentinula edodes]KAJ3908054.1 hypothetical protein F5879DRAFT_938959 [Lentinula edodes]
MLSPCTSSQLNNGYYSVGDQCVQCPAGSYCRNNQKYDCVPGTYNSDIGSSSSIACSSCPLGTSNPNSASSSASDCTPCSPGSYSSSLGAMQCTACPAGTSNLKSGSISSSSCTSCGAGYYSEPGVSQCTVCPAGHYCSGGDKFACPAGTSNSLTGSMNSFACTICPVGSVSGPGSSQCNECPAGTFETGDNRQCRTCSAGTFSLSGSSSCSECSEGTYQPNFGQSQCITAAPGHYVSNKRSNTQTPCDAGSAQPLSGQKSCDLCAPGFFQAQAGQVSCCQCCAGFYSSNFGSKTCSQCGAQGTQSRGTSHPGSTSASACMAGSNPQPVKTCSQASNDICPAVIAKTPSKRSPSQLHADFCSISVPRRHWCKVLNGGMECVDTMNDLEMCGGCLEPGHAEDLTTGARDCSAIEGVGNVQCKQGKCEIGSCRKGFQVSTDGRTCVRVKLADIHKRLSHASTKSKGWEVSL